MAGGNEYPNAIPDRRADKAKGKKREKDAGLGGMGTGGMHSTLAEIPSTLDRTLEERHHETETT